MLWIRRFQVVVPLFLLAGHVGSARNAAVAARNAPWAAPLAPPPFAPMPTGVAGLAYGPSPSPAAPCAESGQAKSAAEAAQAQARAQAAAQKAFQASVFQQLMLEAAHGLAEIKAAATDAVLPWVDELNKAPPRLRKMVDETRAKQASTEAVDLQNEAEREAMATENSVTTAHTMEHTHALELNQTAREWATSQAQNLVAWASPSMSSESVHARQMWSDTQTLAMAAGTVASQHATMIGAIKRHAEDYLNKTGSSKDLAIVSDELLGHATLLRDQASQAQRLAVGVDEASNQAEHMAADALADSDRAEVSAARALKMAQNNAQSLHKLRDRVTYWLEQERGQRADLQ